MVALALLSVFFVSGTPEERRISIYSNVANYSLTVVTRNGTDYVGLLEILEPLGSVSAKTSKNQWRLQYNDVEGDFAKGKTRVRVRNSDFDLSAPFLLDGGRGLVSLSSLSLLLPRILGGPVNFNPLTRRLFIGNVGIHFTAQVVKINNSPLLIMNFTAPVNPVISTEPGKLHMLFTHEPVVMPGSQVLTFDSSVIPSASFQESNGAAEVIVSGTVPLMASFGKDGRTITIAPPQTTAAKAAVNTPSPAASSSPAPAAQPASASGAPSPSPVQYFAVIDASHGGEERGAALTDILEEKDVTLAIARRLRDALEARNLPTLLLRDADTTLTLDQRASAANASGAAIYICVHAASQSTGVRLYTALTPPLSGANHGPFFDWETAQASFQPLSEAAVTSISAELRSKQIQVRNLIAPLRPLNNITTAALALEVSPFANDVVQLTDPAFQQLISAAVAAGVSDIRDKLQSARPK